jgi:hypothetical protein
VILELSAAQLVGTDGFTQVIGEDRPAQRQR